MHTDFLEMPLDEQDEQTTRALWVYGADQHAPITVIHGPTSAVRYQGWWHITHTFLEREATVLLDAATVTHFRLIESRERPQDAD